MSSDSGVVISIRPGDVVHNCVGHQQCGVELDSDGQVLVRVICSGADAIKRVTCQNDIILTLHDVNMTSF